MSDTVQAILLGLFVLSTSIWVGGYFAIAIVARVASRAIQPPARVALFRSLGQVYLAVNGAALAVALGTGYALLAQREWNGLATTATVLAAAVVVALGWGVVQARAMGRARHAALAAPDDDALRGAVRTGARRAGLLRAALGVLTLALIAVGSVLATTT